MTLHLLRKIKFKILNISRKGPLVLPISVDCRQNAKIEVICHIFQRQNAYIAAETRKFVSYAESLSVQSDFYQRLPRQRVRILANCRGKESWAFLDSYFITGKEKTELYNAGLRRVGYFYSDVGL